MGIKDFEDLKQRMDQFETNIHEFLSTTKQDLSSKTDQYWSTESHKIELIDSLAQKISELDARQQKLKDDLNSSKKEENEASALSKAFHTKRDRLVEENEFLNKELLRLDDLLKQQTDDLEKEKQSRVSQTSKDADEVSRFENILGLRITASAQDVITFSFENTISLSGRLNELNTVCSITLDVSHSAYQITQSSPELPQLVKEELIRDLIDSDNLRVFLKQARQHLLTLL